MKNEYKGLTEKEVQKRFADVGSNELPEQPPPSNLQLILDQIKSPLVYILLTAGIVTLSLKDYTDSIIIFFAVFLNTVLGFVQERKASRALYALKQLIHPEANVIRNGKI